jgi:hypothetical protein
MLKKSLRWLAFSIAVLFLVDEALPLLDPWHGTQDQWLAAFIVVGFSLLALLVVASALMEKALIFGLRRLGSGDIERGRQILDARIAQRKIRRGAK